MAKRRTAKRRARSAVEAKPGAPVMRVVRLKPAEERVGWDKLSPLQRKAVRAAVKVVLDDARAWKREVEWINRQLSPQGVKNLRETFERRRNSQVEGGPLLPWGAMMASWGLPAYFRFDADLEAMPDARRFVVWAVVGLGGVEPAMLGLAALGVRHDQYAALTAEMWGRWADKWDAEAVECVGMLTQTLALAVPGALPVAAKLSRPLTPDQRIIWDALEGKALTAAELADAGKATDDSCARRMIRRMRENGWEIGTQRGAGYFRPDAPPARARAPR